MEMLMAALEYLAPALLALLGYLSSRFVMYLNKKHKSDYLKGLLERLNDSALEVVRNVYMAYVGPLKKDGKKLSAEEKAMAKAMAMADLKDYYGKKGLDELMKVLGLSSAELDRKLERSLEAKVYESKYG